MKNHEFTNRLIKENSPYLLQHAYNPVDWYPWGKEALELAKSLDRPILVSIGYSACHWCHVMERESFENNEVAAFMNLHFINIKIDREERPDLDHIYMEALQILTGSGGWPLNVFLTPDGSPFFGGTYFPPVNVYNRPSWMDVLKLINDIWKNKRIEAEEQAKKLINHMSSLSASFNNQIQVGLHQNELSKLTQDYFKGVKDKLLKNADTVYGGFGMAPKFPQTMSIQFLLIYSHFYKDQEAKNHALFSLKALLKGGIYDHLAGGLSRYSTDEKWLAPHFEKMLYDNALLVDVLCDAYQISKDVEYKTAIDDIIRFCLDELHDKNGGFYAALDADSDGEEGKYYTWDQKEIVQILGEEASVFCEFFGVEEKGNWEGKNILHHKQSISEFSTEKKIDELNLKKLLATSKDKLHTERKKRNRPGTDDKILLGWNSLLLIALCKSSAVLENEDYRQYAENLYHFLVEKFSENGLLTYHSYKNGEKKYRAFLEDYAYFIKACICLQELTGNDKYLVQAKELTDFVIENFKQEDGVLFYYTHKDQADIIIRKVEIYDAAIPSANGIMSENLSYLAKIFGIQAWELQASDMIHKMQGFVEKYPASFSVWSTVMMKLNVGFKEIIITGNEAEALLKKVLLSFVPNKILQTSTVEKNYPLLKSKIFSTAGLIYVCENFACSPPLEKIDEFEKLI